MDMVTHPLTGLDVGQLWPGCIDLGGWLHTKISVPDWELNTDMFTHPSTNRARRRLTLSVETNALPLHQAATVIRDVTKFEFKFDNVRTSNAFNRFEICRMF